MTETDILCVQKDSERFFRYVFLTDISMQDMMVAASGVRQPDVFQRSNLALMGEVDVFVSHSWHDDVQAKWDALQAWCLRFEAAHKRPPKLWLDFCCIDQTNIHASLPCLPLYLSGCQRFLIIAGTTYVQRLWCAVELFVFQSIHKATGDKFDLSIIGPTEACRRLVEESLLSFDVTKCMCSESTDKARLLGVIEAGSGTMGRFNIQTRQILSICRSVGPGDGDAA
jgi:hypothetical protein